MDLFDCGMYPFQLEGNNKKKTAPRKRFQCYDSYAPSTFLYYMSKISLSPQIFQLVQYRDIIP